MTIVAKRPFDHAGELQRFAAPSPVSSRAAGIDIKLAGSRLEVVTPAEWQMRFGIEPPETRAAFIAGMTIKVRNLKAVEAVFADTAIPHAAHADCLIVAPSSVGGGLIAFAQDAG